MLITRIELENIKSYHSISVEFRRGTTAISGKNGAGKTTLVEALGFALFDYLPYSQARFVREGEKYGRVVVHLVGGDDRPYVVERRCGSGARWFIVDVEADMRLEQGADVLQKLHELFGIDAERPLASLFRDALGVPQGTFTSIFLDVPSKRKQTFDALLQIEDYKTSADYLLDAQKEYKEQILTQQQLIDRLTYETRHLESWRQQLKEARSFDEQQKQQNVQKTEQLTSHEERFALLNEQFATLSGLEQQYKQSLSDYEHAQMLLGERKQQLQLASTAQEVVLASELDFQRHQQAREALQRLRSAAQQRDVLRLHHATVEKQLTTVEANVEHWQGRLAEVAHARNRSMELLASVEQQSALERQHEEVVQQRARYEAIVAEERRLNQQYTLTLRKQDELQQRIQAIEPLVPKADCMEELSERLTQLRVQSNERTTKQKLLQEKRNELREKLFYRDQCADKLRRAEKSVTVIEEHRAEAEEMPGLQAHYEQLTAHRHRLEGNIEGYARSRAQSVGGQCPLLHESCLNIQHRGLASLESYFESLLETEHAQLAQISREQEALAERQGQIQRYAEALNKLEQYIERRDSFAEVLQRTTAEITRIEQAISQLMQELEDLKGIEQQVQLVELELTTSKRADAQVRELPGLSKQVQQLQEQARHYESDLRELRREEEQLRGSEAQLKQIKKALETLNDPRSLYKAQLSILEQASTFTAQLQAKQQEEQELQEELQRLRGELVVYEQLDSEIARQEVVSQQSQGGYQNYLQHEKEAQLFPLREQAYQHQLQTTSEAERLLREIERKYQDALASFDEAERTTLAVEIDVLRRELAALAQRMQHHQEQMNLLDGQIIEAEEHLLALEAAQQEYKTLDDLSTMLEYFRKLIKEAAPHVLKAMLSDISAEANRIFGEIMGDRSAQLSWENDYEIILHRQEVRRTFAQLSGGEQMSAALAVRLALLKKLSTLNLAFFDEPTQSMDELRRTNLAEQIRRVRGFDQLFVISHDDTFEQGLDSLVRLQKRNGETHLFALEEEEPGGFTQEPLQVSSSVEGMVHYAS